MYVCKLFIVQDKRNKIQLINLEILFQSWTYLLKESLPTSTNRDHKN